MAIQVTDLHMLRDQLMVRRQKLETAVAKTQTANLLHLLEQVDHALERVDHGSYGVCEHCAGTVEPERLFADPLTQLCLDCLNPTEQRALEQDLLLGGKDPGRTVAQTRLHRRRMESGLSLRARRAGQRRLL